ncbi:thioesterase family protein [Mycobacterium asiaticum]|nr:thioesterase family protein [Mycobacterium asiaticum]
MPGECNLFMMMDNSKYNRVVDLTKYYMLIHYRKLGIILKRKWNPLTVSLELSIMRPVRLFQKYQVVSKVIYWKNGYVYLEHRFLRNDTLHAMALSRTCFVAGDKLVADEDLSELYGTTSPLIPDIISKWDELKTLKSQRSLQRI